MLIMCLEFQHVLHMFSFQFQLVLEGLRAKQLQDALVMEKRTLERDIQQASSSLGYYDLKAARIDDQVVLGFLTSLSHFQSLLFSCHL